jgi:hypothetical protein
MGYLYEACDKILDAIFILYLDYPIIIPPFPGGGGGIPFYYTTAPQMGRGSGERVYCFTSVRLSVRPSVRPSVLPSFRLSVLPSVQDIFLSNY